MVNDLSPIDNRYGTKTKELASILGAEAMTTAKINIIIDWYNYITDILCADAPKLDNVYKADMEVVSNHELATKHDVYAMIEYVGASLPGEYKRFVHLGLTSEDVVSLATNKQYKTATKYVDTIITSFVDVLANMANVYDGKLMLAMTHGQPALPTTIGKELRVYINRLYIELLDFPDIYRIKFGGAIDTHAALSLAFDDTRSVISDFTARYGFQPSTPATQVDNYRDISVAMSAYQRISNILIDMCKDMWLYTSRGLVIQSQEGVGSSTMSHKTNPIRFENAIANFELFCSQVTHFTNAISKSMMQRDLTTSSLLRNLGAIMAHFVIGLQSLCDGIGKVSFDTVVCAGELDINYQIAAEYVQTILRIHTELPNPHEISKHYFRTNSMTKEEYITTIDCMCDDNDIPDFVKSLLLKYEHENYLGIYGS